METVSVHDDQFGQDPDNDIDVLLEQFFPGPVELQPSNAAVETLGGFIEARLVNSGWTVEELAQKLGCEAGFIQALINGTLPEASISDDFLKRVAAAIDYQPNVLRILLGRDFVPTLVDQPAEEEAAPPPPADNRMDALQREIEQRLDEIMDLLLETVDERYKPEVRADVRRAKQHDFVIKQIEMILARHRTDVRLVEILIDELQATEDREAAPDKEFHRLDIRRIIHYIRENVT